MNVTAVQCKLVNVHGKQGRAGQSRAWLGRARDRAGSGQSAGGRQTQATRERVGQDSGHKAWERAGQDRADFRPQGIQQK